LSSANAVSNHKYQIHNRTAIVLNLGFLIFLVIENAFFIIVDNDLLFIAAFEILLAHSHIHLHRE